MVFCFEFLGGSLLMSLFEKTLRLGLTYSECGKTSINELPSLLSLIRSKMKITIKIMV